MAPTIGRVALDNGFHGSIPGDWVAPPPQNIQHVQFLRKTIGTIILDTTSQAAALKCQYFLFCVYILAKNGGKYVSLSLQKETTYPHISHIHYLVKKRNKLLLIIVNKFI